MRKKIGIISILTLISIIAIIPKSYGAISSKPTTATDGSNVFVNTNVSTSYILCQQMKANGESLYGSTVNPHLATNKDWGAVSYLSNSIYGTNRVGKDKGIQITINGVKYYSTTGNASGVMNWGVNPNKTIYTQTSGLVSNYTSGKNVYTELYNNRNTEYVEYIDPTDALLTKGMAIQETDGYFGNFKTYTQHVPIGSGSARSGLFSGTFGWWRWLSTDTQLRVVDMMMLHFDLLFGIS